MQMAKGSVPGAHFPPVEGSGLFWLGASIVDLMTGRSLANVDLVRSEPKNLHIFERPLRNEHGLVI